MAIDQADIENTANTIRQVFRNRKTVQLGKRYTPMTRHDNENIWRKAAEICIELNADPASFVEAVFAKNRVPGGPFSNQLTGRACRGWYKEFVEARSLNADGSHKDIFEETIDDDIKHALVWAVNDQRNDVIQVLRDGCLWHIADYVRCILLPGDEIVLKKFGRSAASQLTSNPKLIRILTEKGYDLRFLESYK
jgi:hypothetical protein